MTDLHRLEQLEDGYNKLCSAVNQTQKVLECRDYASRMNQIEDARRALVWQGDVADSMHEKELARLKEENLRLRKIAAYVPARVYLQAKEDAGYGDAIHANDSVGD